MPRFAALRLTGLLTLGGAVAVSAALIAAQAPDQQPDAGDKTTAMRVARLLEMGHLSRPKLNDEISKKWARNFLKSLDPQKYYFLKADVDAFLAEDTTLDDKVRNGDISFAKKVFDRFLERSEQRLAQAQEILKVDPDFTIDESMVDDPDRLDWPATDDEARDRLRKWIKYDLLRLKVGKTEPEKARKQLSVRYKDLNRFFHQYDGNELLERYLTSLAMTIDPHSSYMGWKTLEDTINQQLHLSLEGIGASLMMEDGFPVVKEIVPGAPADKDGRIQVEDKIVGIEDENGEKVDFVEKKLNDVVRKIRGKAGTKVRLIVQPAEAKEFVVYELTRDRVDLKESRAKGQVIETKGDGEKPLKIGVIHLSSFYGDLAAILKGDKLAASATRDCRRIIDGFKADGVDSIVVDLRGNGGGLLQEAITLSGLFIDQGPVVQVREVNRVRHHDDEDEGTAWDGPLAVIIDRFSASASEIFAGVIKDYGRGLIVGDKSTYGKGTVQQIISLDDIFNRGDEGGKSGALKLTIQQFFRANGESTQIQGVPPDVHIPSLRDEADFGEGKSESALKFAKIEAMKHDAYGRVPAELVARLVDRSVARRKDNPKFKEQEELIRKYLDRKARHEISLNEKTFRAEVLGDDEDGDDEAKPKEKGRKRHSDRPAWESNFYNDEVIAIVADYVTLGSRVVAGR